MFEKMSEYRARRRQRWLDQGRREGRLEARREARLHERENMLAEMRRLGVNLPQEAIDYLAGKPDNPEC